MAKPGNTYMKCYPMLKRETKQYIEKSQDFLYHVDL